MPGSTVPLTFSGLLAACQAGAGPPLPAESVHQAPGRGQEAGPESRVAPGSFWPPAGPVRRAARRRGERRGKASGTDGRRRAAPQDSAEQGAGRPWRETAGRRSRQPPRRRIPGRVGTSPPPSSTSSRREWSRQCRPGWDPPADTFGAPGCGDGAGAARPERKRGKDRSPARRGGR